MLAAYRSLRTILTGSPYVMTVGTLTRSVVSGLLVTSFAQGLIAGIGYAIIGPPGAAVHAVGLAVWREWSANLPE